jgi:SAM-dependent methyltransferase
MTGVQPTEALPLPPMELRAWVGPTDEARYDNPGGALVYAHIPIDNYRSVLDFGCGCGRVARQLILQYPRPQSYVGLDVHPGAISWSKLISVGAAYGGAVLGEPSTERDPAERRFVRDEQAGGEAADLVRRCMMGERAPTVWPGAA